MPVYKALLHTHLLCVALSAAGFVARGMWMLQGSARLNAKLVRVLPHVIDTLLLASAVGLMAVTHMYPFQLPWLTAKLFGLIAYIVLGTLALKRAPTRGARLSCFVAALLVLAWMVSVAISKNPLGLLAAMAG